MTFTGTLSDHLGLRLRRGLVVLAAAAALAAAPDAVADTGSYQATCGHLGVPCLDDARDRKRAKRACREARTSRARTRRARKACRAARAQAGR